MIEKFKNGTQRTSNLEIPTIAVGLNVVGAAVGDLVGYNNYQNIY